MAGGKPGPAAEVNIETGSRNEVAALQDKIEINRWRGRVVSGNDRIGIWKRQHVTRAAGPGNEFHRLDVATASCVQRCSAINDGYTSVQHHVLGRRPFEWQSTGGVIAPTDAVDRLSKGNGLPAKRDRGHAPRGQHNGLRRDQGIGGWITGAQAGLEQRAQANRAKRREQRTALVDVRSTYSQPSSC